jgi:hypothetical protein
LGTTALQVSRRERISRQGHRYHGFLGGRHHSRFAAAGKAMVPRLWVTKEKTVAALKDLSILGEVKGRDFRAVATFIWPGSTTSRNAHIRRYCNPFKRFYILISGRLSQIAVRLF